MNAGGRRSSVATSPVLQVLIVLVLGGGLVQAQLPVARLTSLFPAGGRAGSTVEVTIAGADLDDVTRLAFSHTNIVSLTNNEGKFVVAIAGEAPPGIYDARVVGRYGISNPRAFAVSDQPEMVEAPGNSNPSNAMELVIGSVLNGRTDPNAADYFKVALKTGQRVFIECAASDLDSRCLPVLTLFDDSGRELTRNRKGQLLDFTASRDVKTTIRLHDFLFRGGPEYHYRLSVRMGPHIDFISPIAAARGTTNKQVVYGRNLPGGAMTKEVLSDGKQLEELVVDIVAPAHGTKGTHAMDGIGIEGFHYRLSTTNGFSNPIFIGFATAPIVAESEPNTKPDQSQKVIPPCEVNGRFHPAGDQDWFTFDAKKGEAYWIDIFSERLSQPTDPFVLVQRLSTNGTASDVKELYDGEALNAGDMKAESRDPSWRLEVNEDGAYRVQARDLFNRIESDPSHAYRLSIRRDSPGFDLLVCPETPLPAKADSKDLRLWPPFLRRGETLPLRVTALRRDYTDSIDIAVEGLPSGIIASPTRIPSGKNSALLLLSSADDAPGWAGSVSVVGTGRRANEEIKRQAQAAMLIHPVEDRAKEPLLGRLCDEFAFAVSSNEVAPITIKTAEDKTYDVGSTGKVSIPLKIRRQADFTEAFKLKPPSFSVLESLGEIDVPANGTNVTVEIDLAKHKLSAGEHTLFFRGQTKGKYRRNPEAVTLAEQQLKSAEQVAADLGAEIKKAEAALATLSSDAKAAAEKSLADLKAKLKEAEAQKTAADATHKKAVEKAKPQDVTITVYSAPILIRVAEEKKVASNDKK